MSSPLVDVWEAAASQPFSPTVGKNTQFTVGFVLLATCMSRELLACLSGRMLTMRSPRLDHHLRPEYAACSLALRRSMLTTRRPLARQPARSWGSGFISIRVRGLAHARPPSRLIANSFGAVYMICAVGVYV